MGNLAIVIHGGAGPDSEFIRKNKKEYEDGLRDAVNAGYNMLLNKRNAIDAVEAAVRSLEDNTLFNAGKGSALNAKAEVEMDASIMDGKNLNSGAVTMIRNIKNPVSVAKAIMQHSNFIYLGNAGALDFAKKNRIELEPDSYFITTHQVEEYEKQRKRLNRTGHNTALEQIKKHQHGTVGAVALDSEGNIASATSTGGLSFGKEGRVSESSMIGIGTFADNNTCAVSSTGTEEILMKSVIAHSISSLIKYKGFSLGQACKEVVHKEIDAKQGEVGIIALDKNGDVCLEFNCDRMHRGWQTEKDNAQVAIYKD